MLYFNPALTNSLNALAQPGDIPVTGNWAASYSPTLAVGANAAAAANGRTRTGVFRPSTGTFFFDTTGDGTFQGRAYFGMSGDLPLGVPVFNGYTVLGVNLMGNY